MTGRCRIVHVDGSHAYPIVRHDIALARTLERGDIVALDDVLNPTCLGAAVAIWEASSIGSLNRSALPIRSSTPHSTPLYRRRLRLAVEEWASTQSVVRIETMSRGTATSSGLRHLTRQ